MMFLLLLALLLSQLLLSSSHPFLPRGGSITTVVSKATAATADPYYELAKALQTKFQRDEDGNEDDSTVMFELDRIAKVLQGLSSGHKTLKGLDGVAHEAYQRARSSSDDDEPQNLASVSGRAQRNAARVACTADAFLSAELCEVIEEEHHENGGENGTLANRQVILDEVGVKLTKDVNVSVLVLWEPSYSGGAGLEHGRIDDLVDGSNGERKRRVPKSKGRILVIVRDPLADSLPETMDVLDVAPLQVDLKVGLVASEIASVHPILYRTAGRVVKQIEPLLRTPPYNSSDVAFHFAGRSLGGSVASLAAVILDGSLPIPSSSGGGGRSRSTSGMTRRKKKKRRRATTTESKEEVDLANANETAATVAPPPIGGLGRGRSSAMVLGAPPCLSSNIKAAFVRSIIFGDDAVCRMTKDSIDRLGQRTKRGLKTRGGILGRQMGWMTDTVSLTVSSLQSHARGSEGEEERLSVPGQVYLIRPRRLGGSCSMHEVGGLKGGREALRAAVLWQLQDVLLSKSLWKHHALDSYIQGLDRVQFKGL